MKYTFTFEGPNDPRTLTLGKARRLINEELGKRLVEQNNLEDVPAIKVGGFDMAAEEPYFERRQVQVLDGAETFSISTELGEYNKWLVIMRNHTRGEVQQLGSGFCTINEANALAREAMTRLVAVETAVSALFELDTD